MRINRLSRDYMIKKEVFEFFKDLLWQKGLIVTFKGGREITHGGKLSEYVIDYAVVFLYSKEDLEDLKGLIRNTNRMGLLQDNRLILSLDECSVFNEETEESEIGVRLFKEIWIIFNIFFGCFPVKGLFNIY